MGKQIYIIYATRKINQVVVSEVGIAEHTTDLGYRWIEPRYQIDSKGNAGELQRTIDRLVNTSTSIGALPWDITDTRCAVIKPKLYTGIPYLVRIVEEET